MSKSDTRDRRTFYLYVVVVAAGAALIGRMFFDMWVGGGYDLLIRFTTAIPFIPNGAPGVEVIVLFLFGLFVSWLFLFAHDYRKRYQGGLLLIGTLMVIVSMTILGRGVQNIDPTFTNLGAFVFGTALGVLSEGIELDEGNDGFVQDTSRFQGNLRDIDFERSMFLRAMLLDGTFASFPIASLGLVYLVRGLVIVGNIVNIVVNVLSTPIVTIVYLVGSGLFLVFFERFVSIDVEPNERSFEVLGPQQSGKTFFALGLYQTVTGKPERYELVGVGGDLPALNSEYHRERQKKGENLSWDIIGATEREINRIEFSFLTKKRFPTRVNAEMEDHPGEVLGMIGELFDKGFISERGGGSTGTVAADGGRDIGEDDEDDEDDGEGDADQDYSATGKEWWEEGGSDDDGEEDSDEEDEELFPEESQDVTFSGTDEDAAADEGQEDNPFGDEGADGDAAFLDDEEDQYERLDVDAAFPDKNEDQDQDQDEGIEEDAAFPGGEEDEEEDEDAEYPDEDAAFAGEDEAGSGSVDKVSFDADESGASTGSDVSERAAPTNESQVADDEDRTREEIARDMRRSIQQSDKVVFLLDSERFYGIDPTGSSGGGLSIEEDAMIEIADNADVDEIILVASKADKFIDDWQDSRGHNAQPKDSQIKFQDFSDYVEERFLDETACGPLATKANSSTVHPVYFETEKVSAEEGEQSEDDEDSELVRLPKSNDKGHIIPQGFEEVLDELSR